MFLNIRVMLYVIGKIVDTAVINAFIYIPGKSGNGKDKYHEYKHQQLSQHLLHKEPPLYWLLRMPRQKLEYIT